MTSLSAPDILALAKVIVSSTLYPDPAVVTVTPDITVASISLATNVKTKSDVELISFLLTVRVSPTL